MKVENLTTALLRRATGGAVRGKDKRITGVSIDSRTIKKGEVFFAVKGESYDGHGFAAEALLKGASWVVVSRRMGLKQDYILVPDTTAALGKLAAKWRRRFHIPCIGVTGTSGKTTTRGIIAHLLAKRYQCCESIKNYNNFVGLPLSILQITERTTLAVIELAMNRRGEIRKLAHIADPSMGVVTNVGRGHLEFLGSLENVAKAKAELLTYLKKGDVAVLNFDDPLVRKMARKTKAEVVSFGIDSDADFRAGDIRLGAQGSTFSLNGKQDFELSLYGKMNVYNAVAALATAAVHGLNTNEMRRRLASIKPLRMRLQRISVGGITIFNDSYNANPDSMSAAIAVAAAVRGKRKVACLGDMLELGDRSIDFHREVGRKLAEHDFDVLLLYGPFSRAIGEGFKANGRRRVQVAHFSDRKALTRKLLRTVRKGDVVLIKASHAQRLDLVADELITNLKRRT
jgi:UDP-N-acetylmuramoyl-tripeptide--D-alanyl-D-alanine ligase